jgi:hypothetical protein
LEGLRDIVSSRIKVLPDELQGMKDDKDVKNVADLSKEPLDVSMDSKSTKGKLKNDSIETQTKSHQLRDDTRKSLKQERKRRRTNSEPNIAGQRTSSENTNLQGTNDTSLGMQNAKFPMGNSSLHSATSTNEHRQTFSSQRPSSMTYGGGAIMESDRNEMLAQAAARSYLKLREGSSNSCFGEESMMNVAYQSTSPTNAQLVRQLQTLLEGQQQQQNNSILPMAATNQNAVHLNRQFDQIKLLQEMGSSRSSSFNTSGNLDVFLTSPHQMNNNNIHAGLPNNFHPSLNSSDYSNTNNNNISQLLYQHRQQHPTIPIETAVGSNTAAAATAFLQGQQHLPRNDDMALKQYIFQLTNNQNNLM